MYASRQFVMVVGSINALSLVNFANLSSHVALIYKRNHTCYKKAVTECIALATDIFVMRIMLLIWKFLYVNGQGNRVVVDSALLKKILYLFPVFLGPIQQECMELFTAFPSLDPKMS